MLLGDAKIPNDQVPRSVDMSFFHIHLNTMEETYGRPAKQFFRDSFHAYPVATSVLAVFAVISFVPVVSAIALALFACFLAATGCLIILVAVALFLSVVVSVTFVFSAITTLMAHSLRRPFTETVTGPTTAGAEGLTSSNHNNYTQHACAVLDSTAYTPLKASSWTSRFLAFLVLRNPVACTLLPRKVRYHRFYPVFLFGSNRKPYPLKWVLLRHVSRISAFVCWPLHIISPRGWAALLAVCILLVLFSPRARSAARRCATFTGDLKPDILAYLRDSRNAALPALVGFLRGAVDKLEGCIGKTVEGQPTTAEKPTVQPVSQNAASHHNLPSQNTTPHFEDTMPVPEHEIVPPANILNWTSDATDPNSGTGMYGTCCNEMDIWEANMNAEAYTPHPCSVDGVCDKDGCDFNSWRMGDQTFLGPGMTVDTTQPITVVTQFITADNTTTGTLSEIRRIYVQNGKVIQNSNTNLAGISPAVNSISDSFCTAQKTAVGDTNYFETLGGLKTLGQAIGKGMGMVLALSIWDDHEADMLWLDSDYPTTSSPTAPGVSRGPCSATSGTPATVESGEASDYVIFSDIKFGPLGSTTGTGTGGSSPPPVTTTSPPSTPTGGSIAEYGQCSGIGWTGSGTCVSGTTCNVLNPYYSQCLA
ncbi:glycosyl hydrolase family 7-domain-containing protein [Mycena epipterygia]|nr:glycosyl hydrolase family 7-domain-containing protein [Mycena epipterygia]